MNVYKRLQTCRSELKKLPIKESGNNKFAGYTYMELGDFLPHIVDLCMEHGLCTVVSFGDVATLTVVNSDKPEEKIVFTSPMSTAELKGCHAIQNLGAVETYLRRYLYVAAFDIVEHDALDSTHGKDAPTTITPPAPTRKPETKTTANPEQVETLRNLLLELCAGDEEQAKYVLGEISSFPKDGKTFKLEWDKLPTASAKWVNGVTDAVRKKIAENADIPF